MKLTFFILTVFICLGEVAAQNQKCGYPNYFPKSFDAHEYIDTCNGIELLFKRSPTPKWYFRGVLRQSSTPNDQVYLGANGVLITVTFTDAIWYNTTTNLYSKYKYSTGAWISDAFNYQDLRDSVNVWKKKNTFQDSLIAEKGLKANGLISAAKGLNSDSTITSKGVNTEGSNTKAAAQFRGVLSMNDTTITSNYTANGRYGRITGDCASNNVVLTLPTPSAENLGWCYELSKKEAATFNFRVTQGSFSHVIFSPAKIIRVRQKGGYWDLD